MLAVSEGLEEIAVGVRRCVPFLDRRRCFLCSLEASSGGPLCRNRFIIENGIIRILDCLAGQQKWRQNEDGNGLKRVVCSQTGGGGVRCKHGGG